MRYLLGVSVFVLLVSSCSYKAPFKQQSVEKISLQESIARLSSIPDVPLGVQVKNIIKLENDPDSLQVFCYYGSMKAKDLKIFYNEEMERIGWRLIAEYDGAEILLNFEKPSGIICVISIRMDRQLVITLITKKETS